MPKIYWENLIISSVILGTVLNSSYQIHAQTAVETLPVENVQVAQSKYDRIQLSQTTEELDLDSNQPNIVQQPINQDTEMLNDPMAQIAPVSQLSDVQPTDWAFQALQNLVEHYNCIAGYPDSAKADRFENRTFLGNNPVTRYEFAASLNTCLESFNRIQGDSGKNLVRTEDLTVINRLLTEFQTEITNLQSRVNSLETRATTLEKNQFSSTTKLNGQVIIAANHGIIKGAIGDSPSDPPRQNHPTPNPTVFSYLFLNVSTSFTGFDELVTDFSAGSGTLVNEATNVTPAILSYIDYSGVGTNLDLSELRYSFPLLKDVTASVFLKGYVADFLDYNNYANDSSRDFSTSAFLYNLLVSAGDAPSAGAVLNWNPNKSSLTFKALYRADAAASPIQVSQHTRGGLFGDPNLAVFEAEFIPSQKFGLRLDYSLGSQGGNRYSAIGSNFEFVPFQGVALFGRFAHAFQYSDDVIGAGVTDSNAKPTSWMAGISFPDTLGKGTMAGFAVGQPFIEDSVGDVTQLNMEAFYRFPVNENMTITPLMQVIVNPGNLSSSGTLYTGTIRMSFFF